MNERQLRSFVLISSCGSISKAAHQLYISAQSLSQQIDLLENDLGFVLFRRNTKGVELTPAGEHFLCGVRSVLESMGRIVQESAQISLKESFCLRIGMSNNNIRDAALTAGIYSAMKELHPEVRLESVPIPMGVSGLRKVADGKCHVYEFANVPSVACFKLCCDDLFMDEEPWKVIISPTDPLAERKSLRPEDLRGRALFCVDLEWTAELQSYLETYVKGTHIDLYTRGNSVYTVDHSIINNMCNQGAAFIMHPTASRKFTLLHAVPLDFDMKLRYGFVHRPDPPAYVRDFLDVARKFSNVSNKEL